MKKISALFLSLSVSSSCYALEFYDALAKAYETNPKIKATQEELVAEMQKYPQTLSEGFLPSISAKHTSTTTKNRARLTDTAKINKHDSDRSLTISQNIFAGGSSVANLAATKHGIDAAKIKYISQEQEFLLDATSAYIDVIIAKEKLDASSSYLLSVEKQFEAAEEKMKLGEATQTDVAAARANKAGVQAQKARDYAAYLTKRSNFETFFGMPAENIKLPEVPQDIPTSFEDFEKKSKLVNLQLRFAEAQMKAAKNSVSAQKGRLLPTLDAQASKNRATNRNEYHLSANGTNVYTTSLILNIPILQNGGSEHSKIRAAKARLRKTVYEQDYASKANKTQLIQHWETFQAAKEAVIYTDEAVNAQKLELEGFKSMYNVGLKSILDVLDVEKKYYEAIVENIQTKEQLFKTAFTIKSDLAQLTAKHMSLKTKPFDPEQEFRKTKFKAVGF